jgi:hypothetical protein
VKSGYLQCKPRPASSNIPVFLFFSFFFFTSAIPTLHMLMTRTSYLVQYLTYEITFLSYDIVPKPKTITFLPEDHKKLAIFTYEKPEKQRTKRSVYLQAREPLMRLPPFPGHRNQHPPDPAALEASPWPFHLHQTLWDRSRGRMETS